MNLYLDNYYRLFSDQDKEVYQAIIQKKDWVLMPLYLPCDLSVSKDENGKDRFFGLEAILDDVLIFKAHEEKKLEQYRYIKFKTNIEKCNNAHFYVEYDFHKIDQKGYHLVMANFFPCMEKLTLQIDESSLSSIEFLKYFMVGDDNEAVIVLEKDKLLNDRLYAPIIKRIILNKEAPKEIVEFIEYVKTEKNIEVVIKK